MYQSDEGAAVPEPLEPEPPEPPALAVATAALAQLSVEQGHHTHTTAGRLTFCAMALAVVVRVAAKTPRGSRERKALARAAAELREVV